MALLPYSFIGPGLTTNVEDLTLFSAAFVTYDGEGERKADVTVYFRLLKPPADHSALSMDNGVFSVTSDNNGDASVTLVDGAMYTIWAGIPGRHSTFTADQDSSTGGVPAIVES